MQTGNKSDGFFSNIFGMKTIFPLNANIFDAVIWLSIEWKIISNRNISKTRSVKQIISIMKTQTYFIMIFGVHHIR